MSHTVNHYQQLKNFRKKRWNDILVTVKRIKQVHSFSYLGLIVTSDAMCRLGVRSRIVQTEEAFRELDNIIKKKIFFQTRPRVKVSHLVGVVLQIQNTDTLKRALKLPEHD